MKSTVDYIMVQQEDKAKVLQQWNLYEWQEVVELDELSSGFSNEPQEPGRLVVTRTHQPDTDTDMPTHSHIHQN